VLGRLAVLSNVEFGRHLSLMLSTTGQKRTICWTMASSISRCNTSNGRDCVCNPPSIVGPCFHSEP